MSSSSASFPPYTVARCSKPRCTPSSVRPYPEYSLALWHGFTPELLMSVVAISGGVAVYFIAALLLARQ